MDIVTITPAPMRWSLNLDDLCAYTARQLALFSNRPEGVPAARLSRYGVEARERVQRCFQHIRRKYYFDGENTIFNHLHGDHYAIYLYYLSNTVHRAGDEELAQQLFLLNKCLHGADLFYAVELPDIFLVIHPVGTVLGNARYADYFVAYQNCGVGSLEDGVYPTFEGENVLFARSSVLGKSRLGRNVVVGANTFVMNTDVGSNQTVVGSYPALRTFAHTGSVIERLFR